MRTKRIRASVYLILVIVAAMLYPRCGHAGTLERVSADRVCMVNDKLYAVPQIAVQVAGKTYFGCCEMCKGRLASDAVVRHAVDPVSGKSVDKASAVIGALPDGKVLYFESEAQFNSYRVSQ